MNKKLSLLAILAVAWFATFVGGAQASCIGTGTSCTENVTVEVEILPGDICIGTTWAFDFGQYMALNTGQTQNGAFSDPFWVDDLKWHDDGYYTTVQLSGNMQWPGASFIPASNVFMSVASTSVTTIAGSVNPNVNVAAGLLSYSPLNSAVTFIQRPTGVNNGLIGRYGSTPLMQVIIDAYQAVGTYTATMVYTIYEN